MISLCFIVHERDLQAAFRKSKSLKKEIKEISEVVILCQTKQPWDMLSYIDKWPEHVDILYPSTVKGMADFDRQFCYNLASKEYVLSLDADEYPDKTLIEKIPHLLSLRGDVYWFKFKNLVNGRDIKGILGDDQHPRLWRKGSLEWPQKEHVFPHHKTNNVIFVENCYILHERKMADIIKTHDERLGVMSPDGVRLEKRFIGNLKEMIRN